MEHKQLNNSVAGTFPEFGAIFMSNIATKRECLKRKLFGLPSSLGNFVEQVKAGMVLFLFEFERRELYGVFRASSDGRMNIVPDAYSSSGKHFPAQVCFAPIWYCSPLSEKEFCSAIRENYFSSRKFNFGLSLDQVHRLLQLFSARKLKNEITRRQFPREAIRSVGKDTRIIDDARFGCVDVSNTESDVEKGFVPALSSKHLGNSLYRIESVDDDRFLRGKKVESEPKLHNNTKQSIWPCFPGDYVGKERRINDGGRFFLTDVTENEHYNNNGPSRATWGEYFEDSSRKVSREVDRGRFLIDNRVENDRRMDNGSMRMISSEYYGDCFGKVRGAAEHGRPRIRNMTGNDSKLENGSGPVISQEHLAKPLGKVSLMNMDGEFLMNDNLENKRYIGHEHGPVCSPENIGHHLGKVRVADENQYLMNEVLQSEQYTNSGCRPLASCELQGSPTGRIRRATNDDGYLMREVVETEHDLKICQGTVVSERMGNLLGEGRRVTEEGRFSTKESIVNAADIENGLRSTILNQFSGYSLGEGRSIADDGRFKKSDRVEAGCFTENCLKRPNSTDYIAFSESKQNPLLDPCRTILERDYSFLQDKCSPLFHATEPHNIDFFHPKSRDAIVKRAYPYDPEIPNLCYKHSLVDEGSNSLKDCPHLHSSQVNFSFNDRSSPYHLGSKGLSRCFDVASYNGNDVSLPIVSNFHDGCDTNNSSLNAGYSENKEQKSSGHDSYRGSLFPEPSLASIPLPRNEISCKENRGPLSYAIGYCMNPSGAFNNGYHVGTQGKYEHEMLCHRYDEPYGAKDLFSFCANESCLNVCFHAEDSVNDTEHNPPNGKHSCSRNNRTSVFTRLTLASEDIVREEHKDDSCLVYDNYMNASVDEVIDILWQGQNYRLKKPRRFKPSVGQLDDDKIAKNKMLIFKRNQINNDHSTTMKEVRTDVDHAFIESGSEVPEETRLVDFKRRSEIKKNTEHTDSKGSFKGKTPAETVVQGKQGKRRKLVRPVFDSIEGIDFDGAPSQLLPSQLHCLNKGGKAASENLGKSCENISSENVGLPSALSSSSNDGNIMNAEENSNSAQMKNSENPGAPFGCYDGKDAKKLVQSAAKFHVPLGDVAESTGNGSYLKDSIVKGSSQDHRGVTSCSLTDQKLQSGVGEVIPDCENCGEDQELFQAADSATEVCPVNSYPLDNVVKNGSSLQNMEIKKVTEKQLRNT